VTSNYADGVWLLGQRRHRALECRETVYLRVTHGDGRRECLGPYDSLKVTGGAILSAEACLGTHAPHRDHSSSAVTEPWREIAILSQL
jgi:hypothetical protein